MTDAQAEELCDESKRVYLEMDAGEVCLLHNWLMHASDVNRSDHARRAFSVCYADARTMGVQRNQPAGFARIFGPDALDPDGLSA